MDAVQYGLASPRIRVSLQLSGKGTRGLLVGANTEGVGQIYVQPTEGNSVDVVDKAIYDQLNRTVFDLRDKRVLDFQRTEVNRFEVTGNGRKRVCDKNMSGQWELKEPISLKADQTAVDDLLFGVDSLKAVEFVSEHPTSLQPYGLDAPVMQVSFMKPGANPAVLLVGKTKGDTVYVKAQHADTVFLVKKDLLNLIGGGVEGLRDKQVLDFKSEDAVKLVLRHGDVTLACQRQGTNWRLTQPVQEDAKNGAVNSIIYQLNQLKVEKFLTDPPTTTVSGLDAPAIQVTVTLKDRTEYSLQIGKPAESERFYARLTRSLNQVFLLKTDIVEKLKVTVNDLRASSDGA